MGKIMSCVDKFGWFAFLPDTKIQEEDIINLPPLPKNPDKKTPAKRLRAVLYILWKQNGEKGDPELFYNSYMEKIINKIKDNLI